MQNRMEKLTAELSIVLLEKKELEKREKELKEKIMKHMESSNHLTIDNEYIKITYVLPQSRKSLDTIKLKKNDQELYDNLMTAFGKETITKPSLRVTLHG